MRCVGVKMKNQNEKPIQQLFQRRLVRDKEGLCTALQLGHYTRMGRAAARAPVVQCEMAGDDGGPTSNSTRDELGVV